MSAKASPQTNFLAVTGLVADPEGRCVHPPRGPLSLPWLFHVPAETARRGRERLAQGQVALDQATLAGWFCVAAPHDQMALDQLEQRAWRKSLKIWKAQEGQRWALHNRATLHRLMFLAEDQENRGSHLRKSFELYHRLAKETKAYSWLADWSWQELKTAIFEANQSGDDDMVSRSLLLVSQALGMTACEGLQEELMLTETDDLALFCATLARELLPYQGVVQAPPHQLLARTKESIELDVLPPAVRLNFRLVVGSRQRRRVDAMVAELCGLLAQSLFKAGEGRAGQKWQAEARRWEPKVAESWPEPAPDRLGDEAAPKVEFSEPEGTSRSDDGPRQLGLSWLGVAGKPSLVRQHEAREEWLEAFRVFGVAVFPLRRFSVYRNLDTGEIGQCQRLRLGPLHYVWQTCVVTLLSFALLALGLGAFPQLWRQVQGTSAPVLDQTARRAEIDVAVERLKRLAEVEAGLKRQANPDSKRLAEIASERQALIDKVQRLEEEGQP